LPSSKARHAVERLLWTRSGERRVPSTRALDAALARLRRRELFDLCELDPRGPLYLLPTRELVRGLAARIRELGARRVLEVASGDGFLSRELQRVAPELEVVASDSGAWIDPRARMNQRERRRLRGVDVPGVRLGPEVLRLDALAAIRRARPDLVLACWLPPGKLLERLIRAPVRYVLEIGARGGVTPGAWSWRYAHEFCEELEEHARCRLDERPGRELHSRVTLYFGAPNPDHALERVRRGDWLWQFRPR
jgi:SAM-dependent methyltransferase